MITHVPPLEIPNYPRGNRQGGLKSTSASQHDDWGKCQRYWHIRSIQGLREAPTDAMQLGTDLHAAFENRVNYGTLPPLEHPKHGKKFAKLHAKHWEGVEEHVFKGRSLDDLQIKVEGRFSMPTWNGGPPWNGIIDLPLPDEDPPLVVDHKTTSDFEWVKTPHELAVTPQMASYAWWALHHAGPFAKYAELYEENRHAAFVGDRSGDVVNVAHLYVRTKGTPEHHYVTVPMTYAHVSKVWTKLLQTTREMERASYAASELDLPPTTTSCSHRLLGKDGCPYRSRCGFAPSTTEVPMSIPLPPGMPPQGVPSPVSSSPLAEKMRAKAALPPAPPPPVAAAPTPPAPPPVAAAPTTVSQVLPPDAPPRDQRLDANFQAEQAQAALDAQRAEEEAAAETARIATEKLAKKAAKAAKKTPAPTPPEPVTNGAMPTVPAFVPPPIITPASAALQQEATITPSEHVGQSPTFTIFVDCYPVKGVEGVLLVEDFVRPLLAEAARRGGQPDYRLIDFGKGKGILAAILQEGQFALPNVLVVSSFATGANEVLDALIPYANVVVKKL